MFVLCIVNRIKTPEECYRQTIFIPFVDSLIQQLSERFSGKTKRTMSEIYQIPSLIEKLPESEIFEFTNLIYQVSPASVRKFSCGNKTRLTRKTFQQRFRKLLNTWKIWKKYFQILTGVLRILLTTTATSASVERADFALRHVKTDFRRMMGEERLNALLLAHVHPNIFLEYDK